MTWKSFYNSNKFFFSSYSAISLTLNKNKQIAIHHYTIFTDDFLSDITPKGVAEYWNLMKVRTMSQAEKGSEMLYVYMEYM